MSSAARLIALDWGTSNLRASLLGEGGRLLDRRSSAAGIMAVPERRFAEVLHALCADWLQAGALPLIASGMIGSRQGWQEAPYLDCPATLAQAAARLTRVDTGGGRLLHIVPGLQARGASGQDDVMRGEETQLWGAGLGPGQCCVLPGTHSKWAWTGEGGAIARFETAMTGELFALLKQHSILGRLMPADGHAPHAEGFERGLQLGLAEHGRLLQALFAVRSAGLMARLPPEGLSDFLSGILIGAEVAAALAGAGQRPSSVTLLGEPALCARYAQALQRAGVASARAPDEATTRGQWRLAQAAGLVPGHDEERSLT